MSKAIIGIGLVAGLGLVAYYFLSKNSSTSVTGDANLSGGAVFNPVPQYNYTYNISNSGNFTSPNGLFGGTVASGDPNTVTSANDRVASGTTIGGVQGIPVSQANANKILSTPTQGVNTASVWNGMFQNSNLIPNSTPANIHDVYGATIGTTTTPSGNILKAQTGLPSGMPYPLSLSGLVK